jgi:hypothetical protein
MPSRRRASTEHKSPEPLTLTPAGIECVGEPRGRKNNRDRESIVQLNDRNDPSQFFSFSFCESSKLRIVLKPPDGRR